MVGRLTLFSTEDCITPIFIQRTYKHRSDKLWRRDEYPLESKLHEMFLPRETSSLDMDRATGLKVRILMDLIYTHLLLFFTFFTSSTYLPRI